MRFSALSGRGIAFMAAPEKKEHGKRDEWYRQGQKLPWDEPGHAFGAFTIEHERRPVTRMAQFGSGVKELKLGEAQGLGLGFMLLEQEVIEPLHELRGRLIRNAPQGGERGARARSQQSAAESLNAFAGDQASALGVASGKRGQTHAAKIE